MLFLDRHSVLPVVSNFTRVQVSSAEVLVDFGFFNFFLDPVRKVANEGLSER
jgi:hypothetical protein